MDDHDPIIGRDSELASLEQMLTSRNSALVLVVGGPRIGKRRLLREFRVRTASYPSTLIPLPPWSQGDAPWLTIDKHTTIDDFRLATSNPDELQTVPDDSTEPAGEVILIYSYRPQPEFHEWFVGTFVEDLHQHPLQQGPDISQLLGRESAEGLRQERAKPPRMIVVAGGPGDLAGLERVADLRIDLGSLPRNAVVAELRRIDAAIADHLEDGELEAYADAVVEEPALLDDLRAVLPLTRPVLRSTAAGPAS